MTDSPAESVRIDATSDGVALAVKVVPGASRSAVAGVWDGALRIRVAAPAESGKANVAVTKLLASVFKAKRGAILIRSGHSRPLKRIEIGGVTVAEARESIIGALR